MPYPYQRLSNFSRSNQTQSIVIRPKNEVELQTISAATYPFGLLVRGSGLSYSDACLLQHGTVIDTSAFHHICSFDANTGIAECQGNVTFADLFLIHSDFIPAVIPGTLNATLAGGIAHDVHGKNNHQAGSLGHHIAWIDLMVHGKTKRCSLNEHRSLFEATIGGLGLTGIIVRVGIRLRNASRMVQTQSRLFDSFVPLLECMQHTGVQHDYQVAWLDLLGKPRALLQLADHIEPTDVCNKPNKTWTLPKIPIRMIHRPTIRCFNEVYYQVANKRPKISALSEFNNPLDRILNWNWLYGKRGLVQFQAVFDAHRAEDTITMLQHVIQKKRATPTLGVLKRFTQQGNGLLSFTKPGFTLAIDFIHNKSAQQAILEMNQMIAELGGNVYLAKDLYLNVNQYQQMYPRHMAFKQILHAISSPMRSDLSKRLQVSLLQNCKNIDHSSSQMIFKNFNLRPNDQ